MLFEVLKIETLGLGFHLSACLITPGGGEGYWAVLILPGFCQIPWDASGWVCLEAPPRVRHHDSRVI